MEARRKRNAEAQNGGPNGIAQKIIEQVEKRAKDDTGEEIRVEMITTKEECEEGGNNCVKRYFYHMNNKSKYPLVFRRSTNAFKNLTITGEKLDIKRNLSAEDEEKAEISKARLGDRHRIWQHAHKLGVVPYIYHMDNIVTPEGVHFVMASEAFDMNLRQYFQSNDRQLYTPFKQCVDLFSRLSTWVVCSDVKLKNIVVNVHPFKVRLIDIDEDYCRFAPQLPIYIVRTNETKTTISMTENTSVHRSPGDLREEVTSVYMSPADLRKASTTLAMLMLACDCKQTRFAPNFLFYMFSDDFKVDNVYYGKELDQVVIDQLEAVFDCDKFGFRHLAEHYFIGIKELYNGKLTFRSLWECAGSYTCKPWQQLEVLRVHR